MFAFPKNDLERANYAANVAENNRKQCVARLEMAELERQAAKQKLNVFSGKLLNDSALRDALDANS